MWALWLLTRRAGWIGTWDPWYIKQDICSKEGHLPHSQFSQTQCAMLLNGSDLSTDLSIAPFPIPLLKELEFGNIRYSVGRTGWASGRPCSITESDPNEHLWVSSNPATSVSGSSELWCNSELRHLLREINYCFTLNPPDNSSSPNPHGKEENIE